MKSDGIALVALLITAQVWLSPQAIAQTPDRIWIAQREATAPDLGERVTYSHAGGLFTVEVPRTWEQENLGDDQVSRAFFVDPDGPSWIGIAIFKSDEAPLSAQELGFRLQKDLKNVFRDRPNFIMDLEPTLQNDNSVRVSFQYDEGTVVMQGNSFIQQNDGYLSLIYIVVPSDQFQELKPSINQILNSYQVNANVLW
ncbi:hypothetical protein L1047_12230 [Synechococcus sp. Nb3U1]|uniref:hypothetical protein n=1 Tax=Synechococcus sp. Nb3U1 TaxID=1914529 RepID=UPI001F2984FC|nr:hypothetical protein [Synechococcus sp. Nb3U1]MCF2971963.1 hypothetical protein [Synechococcus sp. Nb3U1]